MSVAERTRSTVIVLTSGRMIAVERPPEAMIASRVEAAADGTGLWCYADGRIVALADVARVVPAGWLDEPTTQEAEAA